ncbi:uncharacterized protein TNCV_2051841 [Trichonephila clavipes]|nr:uncharacterized protein TNCV_2051841 [Trichonephila clavipes]
MSEKALVDHIFDRLEPQVQDYVEVRNPQTAIQLLDVLAKFEERYSCKATLGSRNNNFEGRGRNERRMPNVGNNRGNWRNSEVERRPNNRRNDYRSKYQNNRQGNQWFENRNRFQSDDRRLTDRGYQFRNRGQKDDFSRGDQRNRGSSENFSTGSRKQMGRLNVLKVNDIKGDQTQLINQSPIKLSAIRMSPVKLPYVPILLDETFTKALWDTGAEQSFISKETYQKYFFINKPQENRTERVNCDLVQMIANYVNEQHDTWDQFLREFAYAILTDVNETMGETPAELFLGRKLITPFQKLVMVSYGTEFAVGDIERLFEEARRNTETKQENGINIIIDVGVMFKLRVLDVKNNNAVIWKAGKSLTINVDEVRIYRHRKCDETEIGTGNSDNGSLHDESSGFDRGQRRSNDS